VYTYIQILQVKIEANTNLSVTISLHSCVSIFAIFLIAEIVILIVTIIAIVAHSTLLLH